MRIIHTALASGLTLLALPAAAQTDGADRAPFDGVYVGGSFGYDVQPNDVGERILFDNGLNGSFGDTVRTAGGADAFSPGFCNGRARGNVPAAGCRNDKDAISYYARVGGDAQFGHVVVGAVGEFGKSQITDSVSAFSTTPASYVMTRKLGWEASVRGRMGYTFDTTLFYGAFGPGYANVRNRFETTNTANAFALNGSKKQWGYVAAGGVEQKLSRNVSVGLEYSFHRYDDDDARVRVGQGTAGATNPFVLAGGTDFRRSQADFNWHSVRATAAFRF